MNYGNVGYSELLAIVRVIAIFVGIVLAVFLAIACVKLADGKGRNTTAWCILGLFFGIVALIVLVFLPDKKEENKNIVNPLAINSVKPVVPGNMWLCDCGASNSISNGFCSVCGKKRVVTNKFDINEYSGGTVKKVSHEIWKCPTCGYENNPKANMCINCGREKE